MNGDEARNTGANGRAEKSGIEGAPGESATTGAFLTHLLSYV